MRHDETVTLTTGEVSARRPSPAGFANTARHSAVVVCDVAVNV
jgi:hypothetical protein